jgi:hypothetical protein
MSKDDLLGEAEINLQTMINAASAFGDPELMGDMQLGRKCEDNALVRDSTVVVSPVSWSWSWSGCRSTCTKSCQVPKFLFMDSNYLHIGLLAVINGVVLRSEGLILHLVPMEQMCLEQALCSLAEAAIGI